MPADPDALRQLVRPWTDWDALWEDPEFHDAFRVVSRGAAAARIRHWTGTLCAAHLTPDGAITGWTIPSEAPDVAAWSTLRPGRRGDPIGVRTRAEAMAVVRSAMQQPGAAAVVDGALWVIGEAPDGPRRWTFDVADPDAADRFDLGPGASTALDPADLVLLASHLEREVDRAILVGRAGPDVAAELRLAAAALDQVQRFPQPITEAAMATAASAVLLQRSPERFTRDHVTAEALRLAARAEAIASIGDAHPDVQLSQALSVGLSVPTALDHLGADLLERLAQALDEASGHFAEAERAVVDGAIPAAACAGSLPPELCTADQLTGRRALLEAQRAALRAAARDLPSLPPFAEIPIAGMSAPAGARVPQPGDPWLGPPDGFLPVTPYTFRHEGGAVLQVTLDDARARVVAATLLTGAQAMEALAGTGHVLLDAQQDQLYAHLEPGVDPRDGLAPLVRGPWRVRPFVAQPAGDGRTLRVFVVDAFAPLWRSALLVCVVDADDKLLWPWLVEGEAAIDQLLRFSAAVAAKATAGPATGTPVAQLLALASQGDHAFFEAVRPREGDAAQAFVGDAAAPIAAAQAAVWSAGELPSLGGGATAVTPQTCTTEGFSAADAAARTFAGGWRSMSHLLAPGRTWASLTLTPVGATRGLRLEGFVWLDDHWAWFPKPWRGLPAAVRQASP